MVFWCVARKISDSVTVVQQPRTTPSSRNLLQATEAMGMKKGWPQLGRNMRRFPEHFVLSGTFPGM